ncbi:putative reductase [Polychytrium aggregatum]|uniref:putative reductase n=1 Tax=Polychytrium aggregatum TaxID=110093 RepID=UPI0022FE9E2B|nr:putative reductase [Polychytrium aggregatum]KAI9208206.1 putative reductase [Polychytrium aggregatum]
MARLSSGYLIPEIGLGVYLANGNEAYQAVLTALKHGYRHIDTASFYRNEAEVGRAIHDSGLPREDVFITTKVWNSDQGYENTLAACESSLNKLGTTFIDLYLIHAPVPETRKETYRALEKLVEERKVRSIGISNYNIHHIEELKTYAKIMPAVNQIELSPYLQRRSLVQYCQDNGIVLEAYSPLTRGEKLNDPPLVRIAQQHGKTTAQVLIKWCLKKGYVTLPKSVNESRIIQNFTVNDFDLSAEDMNVLDGLECGLMVAWNPLEWE